MGLQLQVMRQSTGTMPLNRSDLGLQGTPLEWQYGHATQLDALRCFVLRFFSARTQLQPLTRLLQFFGEHGEQTDAVLVTLGPG